MKGIDPLFFFLKERRDWRVTWTNFKSAQGRKRFMTMGNTITWAAEKFRRDRGRTHRSETKSIGNPRIRVRRWCTQNTSCDEKKDKCSILLAHTFIFTAFNINSSRSSHVILQHQKILQKIFFFCRITVQLELPSQWEEGGSPQTLHFFPRSPSVFLDLLHDTKILLTKGQHI